MWKLKLGPKFVLSLLIISIVPLTLVSAFYYSYSKAELERNVIGSLTAVNDSRATHINHMIQLRQEQAKALAGSYPIRQLRPEGTNDPQVITLIQAHIESIYRELKQAPRSSYKQIDQISDVANISVWDLQGNIVADTNRSLISRRMPPVFLQILYEQGAYFKGFEEDPLTGEKFLTVLDGILNWENREYAGVVFLKSSAKFLNDITTARQGLGDTAETYIIDKQHHMITDSRFEKDAVLRVMVESEGAKACFAGTKAPAVYRNYRGAEVLGVQRYFPDQDWCILTEMDAREAFRPVMVFRNRMLLVVGLLAVLVFLLAQFWGHILVRPIVNLRDASLKLAGGNYNVEAPMASGDEVGELARAFNQMTKILRSTTTQLAEKNKILEKQKEELKRFDELKSEFVSMVSHELRTPMSIIKGSIAQLLEETPVGAPEDSKDLMKIALRNIDRLANLINNLLDLSKIEAGKLELHRESVDLAALVTEVCRGFEPHARTKGIEMRPRFSAPVIMAEVDKDKIIQVFLNLIGNAMKFVDKGSIEVGVQDGAKEIVCRVSDTGRGISQYDMQKVFNKFQQFGRKSSDGPKGTGLGLSISKGLVELHGGRIWLESQLGVGTTFYFSLPKIVSGGIEGKEA